jgi:hypothetical protein
VYLADEKGNYDFESHDLKDYKRVLIELFKILDIFVKEKNIWRRSLHSSIMLIGVYLLTKG